MKNIYFTPGPSEIYFTATDHVKKAFQEQIVSISHRSQKFQAIFQEAVENIKTLLDLPSDYQVYFTGSATEIWERIIQNLVMSDCAHFVNGSFSQKFHQIAVDYGKKALKIEAPLGTLPDFSQLTGDPEMIAVTYNETSAGVMTPEPSIKLLRDKFPDAIIAVDMVSAAPYHRFDWQDVDTAYFSVQKGMGLPAGLGVWIVNDRCLEKAAAMKSEGHIVGSYHSLAKLSKMAVKYQTPETPNVLGIYLLAKVGGDMCKKGRDQILRETEQKAAILNYAIENHPSLSHFVIDEKVRSKTVIVAKTAQSSGSVISALEKKGLVLGSGYRDFKDKHIRIANFPVHSKEQMEFLTDTLQNLV